MGKRPAKRERQRCAAHHVEIGTVERIPFGVMVHGADSCVTRKDSENADQEGLRQARRRALRVLRGSDGEAGAAAGQAGRTEHDSGD